MAGKEKQVRLAVAVIGYTQPRPAVNETPEAWEARCAQHLQYAELATGRLYHAAPDMSNALGIVANVMGGLPEGVQDAVKTALAKAGVEVPKPSLLTPVLRVALLEGPKMFGTYSYPNAIGSFEESLTLEEHETAEKFLGWVVVNNLTYGHGNLQNVFDNWAKEHAAHTAGSSLDCQACRKARGTR